MTLGFYEIGLLCYRFSLRVASFFHPKAKAWVKGREGWLDDLSEVDFSEGKWVWIHCASLGEYEQAKPVLEGMRREGSTKILVSFFSPSGYELRKDDPLLDHVCYLPMDSKRNARLFIDIVQPKMAIFVRYEFWHHYLSRLRESDIPVFLISASFHKNQLFFKPFIGIWFQSILTKFTKIYTIDNRSVVMLNQIGIKHVQCVGDTRADRVVSIFESSSGFEDIEAFKRDSTLFVCGSTWIDDVKLLSDSISNTIGVKWIIAPHDIRKNQVDAQIGLLQNNGKSISYYSTGVDVNSDILILDTIGILAKIYRYADLAYVGGGFGSGIHNVLEPAVYGMPVVFGKKYQKFPEAIGLLASKGGFSVENKASFNELLSRLLSDNTLLDEVSDNAKKYVQSLSGATGHILSELDQYLES